MCTVTVKVLTSLWFLPCSKCKIFTSTPPNSVMTTGVINQMNDNGYLTKEQIMSYVAQGPIVVSIAGDVLNSYNGGVIPAKACPSTQTDHAVLLVGYDRNQKWWKIQNSWGPDWGESGGFFRLAMTDGAGVSGGWEDLGWAAQHSVDRVLPCLLGHQSQSR